MMKKTEKRMCEFDKTLLFVYLRFIHDIFLTPFVARKKKRKITRTGSCPSGAGKHLITRVFRKSIFRTPVFVLI